MSEKTHLPEHQDGELRERRGRSPTRAALLLRLQLDPFSLTKKEASIVLLLLEERRNEEIVRFRGHHPEHVENPSPSHLPQTACHRRRPGIPDHGNRHQAGTSVSTLPKRHSGHDAPGAGEGKGQYPFGRKASNQAPRKRARRRCGNEHFRQNDGHFQSQRE